MQTVRIELTRLPPWELEAHPLTPRARLPSIDLGQSDRRLSSLKNSRRGCYLKGCISKVGQNKFK